MKRLLFLGAVACSTSAFATPVFHDSGSLLTQRTASSVASVMQASGNPAAPVKLLRPGERLRLGLPGSVGGYYELGEVENFVEEVDELLDTIEREDISPEEGEELARQSNDLLQRLGRDGYIKAGASAHVPLLPLVIRSDALGAVISLDANVSTQGQVSLLDSPLTYNAQTRELETGSAVYMKAATVEEYSLGFSRELFDSARGALSTGVRLKYLNAHMAKQTVSLHAMDGDVLDVLKDNYDRDEYSSSAVTADLGILWSAPRWLLGLTVENLSEPEFDYGQIGLDCGSSVGQAGDNCWVAANFGNEIALQETWVLERQATADAAWYFAGGRGVVAASMALNEVNDPVGDAQQWAQVSIGYDTATRLLPAVRVGYMENLAGTELSAATLGLTFLGAINLDLAYGLDSTEVDGTGVPRFAAFNLGAELRF